MEHELRVDGEGGGEAEGGGVVLAVVGELAHQADQHAVDPTKNVEGLLRLCLMRRDPGHQHRRRLLIEASCNLGDLRSLGPRPRQCRHAQAVLTARVLVGGEQLQVALAATRLGRSGARGGLGRHLEVQSKGGVLVHASHGPSAGAAQPNFRLAHTRRLFTERTAVADCAADLEVVTGEHLHRAPEGHAQVLTGGIPGEDLREGLLEDVSCEGLGHDHVASRLLHQGAHLGHTNLV
mmetsp:Transcript_13609/g.44460  ORF Transcript_13609/g.44460 Transcript_13609/m.44460 type:complete len:236 (+) Transcript_13609:661-1368(+)